MQVEGRWCEREDVFEYNGGNYDYTAASIPQDCTTLDLHDNNIGDAGAAAIWCYY